MKTIVIVGVLVIFSYSDTSFQVVELKKETKRENIINFKDSQISTILNFQRKAKSFKDKTILLKKFSNSNKDTLLNLMLINEKELKVLDGDELEKIKSEWIQLPLPGFLPVIVVPTPKPKIPKLIIKPELTNESSVSTIDIKSSILGK